MATTKLRTKKVIVNVGGCVWCKDGTMQGQVFDYEKRHNCNTCGYYQNYNQELIEYNPKTMQIVWSSVN